MGVDSQFLSPVDDLKYTGQASAKGFNKELMNVKIRYKNPEGGSSKLITHAVMNDDRNIAEASADMNFMAGLALFGMELRESEYINGATRDDVITLAKAGKGNDEDGYRSEFLRLVKTGIVD